MNKRVRNCKFHGSMKGCRYGNNCRYSHSNPNSVTLCHYYNNNCPYAKNCRFRHINSNTNLNTNSQIMTIEPNINTIHYTADERAGLILFGFIRTSQKELLKTNIASSNNTTIFNNIPLGITRVCMMYYYDIQIIFDEAFQLFMDSSSATKILDGNKYILDIFLKCARSTNENRHYMINKQLISILGHFYLRGNKSPFTDENWQYHAMDPPPDSSIVIQVITILLRSCHSPKTAKSLKYFVDHKNEIDTMKSSVIIENNIKFTKEEWLQLPPTALSYKASKHDVYPQYLLHVLSEKDMKLPHCVFFYEKMIKEAHHNNDILEALIDLIVHWSYKDKTYSEDIIKRVILEHIDESGVDEIQTLLAIMHKVIMIEDNLQQHRLQQFCLPQPPDKGILDLIKSYRLYYMEWTYKCIKGLISMLLDNEIYANYMINKRDEWMWWDRWLDQHCIEQEKVEFCIQTYFPFLLKYGIKCEMS